MKYKKKKTAVSSANKLAKELNKNVDGLMLKCVAAKHKGCKK